MNWQPIETAPKDQVIDLFTSWFPNKAGFKGLRWADCYFHNGKWICKCGSKEIKNPSHWMPLPEPPNTD